MGEINKKCQVPTPSHIVEQMLDMIGYKENLFGKRLLENSCGEGNFLCAVLRRYINDCLINQYTKDQIVAGIQRDIHGFEKSRRLHRKCIENLSSIAEEYGITGVHWNIKRKNALSAAKKGKYIFAVGNPPYLAYPELDNDTRQFLRSHFLSCKRGKPDYYYAFIESALNALAVNGKLVYLVPGNFMKNMYSAELRNFLIPSLQTIIDYSHQRLFEKVLTSSVILYCDKSNQSEVVYYENRPKNTSCTVAKKRLKGKWIFEKATEQELLPASDFFHASAPVATQLNDAFVVRDWDDYNKDYIVVGKYKIEKLLLRKAAGPKGMQSRKEELIIFPYKYKNGNKLIHFTELEFQTKFPGGYDYLQQFREKLEKRTADTRAQWYEYGRSQLLTHLNQNKIILSSFITGKITLYCLDTETVPYAGLCIIAKNGHTIKEAERILSSKVFFEYVQKIGICTSGGSYRISPTDINSFRFPHSLLEE